MKKILVLALAAAAMVGCSNDEVIGLNREVIGFDNAFVDNTTRLTDPSVTTANITSETLNVWGTTQGDEAGEGLVQIFNGVSVTYDTEWKYNAAYNQYWIAGNTYNFAALVNADPEKVQTATALSGGEETYMPLYLEFTADGTTDLLYARSAANIVGKASDNPKVAFTFDHLLSKVHFSFKNTMTTNTSGNLYQYLVKDIVITSQYDTATYNFSTGKWGGYSISTGTTKVYDFGNIKNDGEANEASLVGAVGAADVAPSENALLLLPATYNGQLTLTCTIETYLNGNKVNSESYSSLLNTTIVKGLAYNFVLSKDVPGDKIEFTVNPVNGWNTTHGDTDI